MNVLLVFRQVSSSHRVVESYARCVAKEFKLRQAKVTTIGEGHDIENLEEIDTTKFDFAIEVENGRNREGELPFQIAEKGIKIPSAVWYIDSHGHPTLHKRLAKFYTHVFFAPWSRRDLFAKHPSAHWAPDATDLTWFGYRNFEHSEDFDYGFFGSRGGLPRADPLKEICEKHDWSYDIREAGKPHRHKWPRTGEAMAKCKFLFNHGQKHDGPNQRVVESMAMRKPLLTDLDPTDGMSKIFVDGHHFIGYESYTYANLEEKMQWVRDNEEEARKIADNGYQEVVKNHTIGSRVDQMIEVFKNG